jgi:hypothetical protein
MLPRLVHSTVEDYLAGRAPWQAVTGAVEQTREALQRLSAALQRNANSIVDQEFYEKLDLILVQQERAMSHINTSAEPTTLHAKHELRLMAFARDATDFELVEPVWRSGWS